MTRLNICLLRSLIIIAVLTLTVFNFCFAFDLPWSDAAKQKKLQKQQQEDTMVHTRDEWLERATDINIEHRKIEPFEEKNEKLVDKSPFPVYFEKYNKAPGSKEFDLSKLKVNKNARSIGVVSPDFKYMAYTECFYFPSNDQVTSGFYIYPLNTREGRKKRVMSANVGAGAKKTELISASEKKLSQYLFQSLTVIDWSKDSKKVLVKERVGSSNNGLYQTYLWVYFMPDGDIEGYAKKFDGLNEVIKDYYYYKNQLILERYRWDIKPLGFDYSNENIVYVQSYTYDSNRVPIFLGLWSVDITTGQINLVSEKPIELEISTNGLILVKKLP